MRAGGRHSLPAPGAASPEVSSAPSWLELSSFLLTLAAGADMVVVRSGARREGGGCSGAEGGGAARRLLLLPLCCRCCCRRRRSAALRRLLRPDLGLPDHRGRQRRSHCLTLPSARIAATASSSSTSSCCCCWRGAGGAGRMRSNPPLRGTGGT